MMTYLKQTLAAASLLFFLSGTTVASASATAETTAATTTTALTLRQGALLKTPTAKELPKKFFYDSGVEIAYPADGVKGIYVTAYSVGYEEKFNKLVDYVDSNDLNAMVIDIKDDMGVVTADFNSKDTHIQENTEEYIPDIQRIDGRDGRETDLSDRPHRDLQGHLVGQRTAGNVLHRKRWLRLGRFQRRIVHQPVPEADLGLRSQCRD